MHEPFSSSQPPHPGASRLPWALYYLSRGWRVLPLHTADGGRCSCGDPNCPSPGAHPRTQDGVKDASDGPEKIRAWWAECPDAGVGIATGSASGLIVFEIDHHNGGDESYIQLQQELPSAFAHVLKVCTGAGGTHLYFQHPGGHIPCRANVRPGIDVKADGGYVVAPPSLTVNGVRYRFASNGVLLLPPLPQPLRDLIFQASSQQGQQQSQGHQGQQSQGQTAGQGQQSQSHQANQSQHSQSQTANQSQNQQSQNQQTAGIQPEPVPWPDPVDGVVLFNELTAALGRYLALPEGALEAMALWVVFTHAFDAAEVSPRLALLSPVPECGKTTALSILSRLVRKAMLASNFSPAVVFRAIDRDQPTLLMDEADTYLEQRGDEFRGILNSGHRRDAAVVWRTVGDKYVPKAFSTWAPMVIAAIGKLWQTLASRSIIIVMRRKRADESVRRYRPNRDGPLLDELARKCARWVKDNLQKLEGADPMMPKQLNNRAADNWRPLFAIADAIGGDCPGRARQAALVLSGDEAEVTPGEQLLANIKKVLTQGPTDRISSKDLCEEVGRICGVCVTQSWLAAMLRPFGIRPHTIRIGQSTPKGYEFKDFEDAFARYLPKNDATSEEN
jgi:Protein of unknown function (DUF3631)/Bifunctional DNA primase/polymerase, N-terminal